MGHYCRICERTRANEKFSGKGHKNHVCKDCSGKSSRKAYGKSANEGFSPETTLQINDMTIQSEKMFTHEDSFSFEIDFEKQDISDDDNGELPF